MNSSAKWRRYSLFGGCLWLLLSIMHEAQATPAPPVSAPQVLRIAAASDLRDALTAISAQYQQQQPEISIQLVFGASGKLQQQIIHGAPFDLYIAADLSYALPLWQQGVAVTPPVVLAIGHLALVSSAGLRPAANLADLTDSRFRRIAIAEPQHAPYGDRAKQSLQNSGLWQTLQPKIVYGENVAKTFTLLQSGAVDAALVALSLLKKPGTAHAVLPIDTQLHQPLKAAFVLLQQPQRSATRQQAAAFGSYLQSDETQAVLRHFGFTAP